MAVPRKRSSKTQIQKCYKTKAIKLNFFFSYYICPLCSGKNVKRMCHYCNKKEKNETIF